MSRILLAKRIPILSILLMSGLISATALASRQSGTGKPWASSLVSEKPTARVIVDEHLGGHSGKLKTVIANTSSPLAGIEVKGSCESLRWLGLQGQEIEEVYCDDGPLLAPSRAGAWALYETAGPPRIELLSRDRMAGGSIEGRLAPVNVAPKVLALRPRAEKADGLLEGYRIGTYPRRPARYGPQYEPPEGFIEVSEDTLNLPLSRSFSLGEFLTKDQHEVWPKFLALDMRLIDKLELVIEELREMGHDATSLFVMSGYRTPHYNGDGSGGRSRLSRHIYGDAADVWLDETGDGRMDDLNGDGRSSIEDARVLAAAASRVQDRYPDLVGGIGVYGPRGARGPFVHIDLRGRRARW